MTSKQRRKHKLECKKRSKKRQHKIIERKAIAIIENKAEEVFGSFREQIEVL